MCIIPAVMLFAAVGSLPYQYYTVLRIVVSVACVYMVFSAYRCCNNPAIILFISIAVLFNPLFPISLSRSLWLPIDIISGILFLASAFMLKKSQKSVVDDVKNNRRRKLFSRLVIGAFIIGVFAVFAGRQVWFLINGNERLSGQQQAIPEPVKIKSPIEKGLADWPCWRGPDGDGKSDVTGIIEDWSNGLNKLWEVNYLCQGDRNVSWSTVAVSGNRLVVPGRDNDNDLVFCFDPVNGELIWFGSYKAQAKSSHGPGARATAYIDEDHVYTFGRSGDLVCWSLEDGQLLWHENVSDQGGQEPQWGHSCSPFVYQDKVIVQGGGQALVIAYDKMTGELIWKSMQGQAGYAATASIDIDGSEKLLIFHGTGLSCIDPNDGAELWSVEWKTSYEVNATTPAVFNDMIFITSGYNTGCQALKVSGDSVESLWINKIIASHHSDPIIIDGFVYGYSGQSNQNKGDFKCVELETGKEMWSTNEIGWGTTVYVDGLLLCMDIKGNLFLIEPNHDEFRKVTEFKEALGEVSDPAWTIPVVANGRLYLRYMQRLICYDIMP